MPEGGAVHRLPIQFLRPHLMFRRFSLSPFAQLQLGPAFSGSMMQFKVIKFCNGTRNKYNSMIDDDFVSLDPEPE